jgi:glutathione S-transferase
VRLYRIPFSTNVERVALALGHKGLAVEYVDVDPADRSAVRRISGQDLVPVLDDDGRIVVDSMAIVAYLEERHPERPLYPPEPSRRAEVLLFIDWFDRVWKRPPNELEAELRKPEPDGARVDALGRQIADALPLFDDLLWRRDYLFGEFSAADCAAFPFLKYALFLDERDDELFHRILRDHQRLDGRFGRLEAWIGRVDGHPRA